MHIFHIATLSDWEAARAAGSYEISTLGVTLQQEGFIHASRREQVGPTFTRFYKGVKEPLVLLTIETDKLASPWQVDQVGDDTFPHIYGPLNTSAVVRVSPLNARGGTESFTTIFVKEMLTRILLALIAMGLAVVGSMIGRQVWGTDGWGPFGGAIAGLLVGTVLFVVVQRRRSRR